MDRKSHRETSADQHSEQTCFGHRNCSSTAAVPVPCPSLVVHVADARRYCESFAGRINFCAVIGINSHRGKMTCGIAIARMVGEAAHSHHWIRKVRLLKCSCECQTGASSLTHSPQSSVSRAVSSMSAVTTTADAVYSRFTSAASSAPALDSPMKPPALNWPEEIEDRTERVGMQARVCVVGPHRNKPTIDGRPHTQGREHTRRR